MLSPMSWRNCGRCGSAANNPTPARRFHYSNVGFMLLGLATSTRARKSFPDLITERLLDPMGMAQSVASVTHDVRPSMAVGYAPAREDRPWVPNDPLAPATWFELATGDGNIASTGADMARLVMLLLEQGNVDGVKVVTAQALERMTTPTAQGGEPIEMFPGVPTVDESTYGLGINVERVGQNILVTHGGGMVGYSTFLLVDQTAGFGIVILTNANGDNLHSQLLARVAHADLSNRLASLPTPELPNLTSLGEVPLGRFLPVDASTGTAPLTIASSDSGDITVEHAGQTGRLHRTLTGRYVTDQPHLRRFHLDPVVGAEPPRWTHGPDLYVSIDEPAEVVEELSAARGQFPNVMGRRRRALPQLLAVVSDLTNRASIWPTAACGSRRR